MMVGRVICTVVCDAKVPALRGHKLLVVRPLDPAGRPCGSSLIAVDMAQAGIGDMVLVLDEGNSARIMVGDDSAPIRAVIAGIVDHVTIDGAGQEG